LQRGAQPGAQVGWEAVGVKQTGYGVPTGPSSSQHSWPAEQHEVPQHVLAPPQVPPSCAHGIFTHDWLQYSPALHLVLQRPQFSGSLAGLTHRPPQQRRPIPHDASQAPPPLLEPAPLELPLLEPPSREPPPLEDAPLEPPLVELPLLAALPLDPLPPELPPPDPPLDDPPEPLALAPPLDVPIPELLAAPPLAEPFPPEAVASPPTMSTLAAPLQ
jgi:hypothetical protein